MASPPSRAWWSPGASRPPLAVCESRNLPRAPMFSGSRNGSACAIAPSYDAPNLAHGGWRGILSALRPHRRRSGSRRAGSARAAARAARHAVDVSSRHVRPDARRAGHSRVSGQLSRISPSTFRSRPGTSIWCRRALTSPFALERSRIHRSSCAGWHHRVLSFAPRRPISRRAECRVFRMTSCAMRVSA